MERKSIKCDRAASEIEEAALAFYGILISVRYKINERINRRKKRSFRFRRELSN